MITKDSVVNYIKTHKVVLILAAVILFILLKPSNNNIYPLSVTKNYVAEDSVVSMGKPTAMPAPMPGGVGRGSLGIIPPVDMGGAPQLDVKDRKFVTQSDLSLVVESVNNSINDIESKLNSVNGILVNKSVSKPSEAQTGYITVRVPLDKSSNFINDLKKMAVKVVYENTNGNDVTDQYYDIQSRLDTLEKNKTRFQEIMDAATKTDEILNIQNQIFSLQDQIDSLKGRLKYLDETSKTVLISISLSTDELSLPYSPDNSWRPSVVFKEAVRSLVLNLRGVGEWLIWTLVYSIFWIPAGIILWILFRKPNNSNSAIPK